MADRADREPEPPGADPAPGSEPRSDRAPWSDGDDDELGEGTGRLGPWAQEGEDDRADKQEGDPTALDVEGDPRGGVQSEEYRLADPREIVTEGDVAMSGPGGAPQEGKSVEERRAESAEWRERSSPYEPSG